MQSGYRFPIESSKLFIVYEMEKKKIDELKWIESEKVGHDITQWRAEWIWWSSYRDAWRRELVASGILPPS